MSGSAPRSVADMIDPASLELAIGLLNAAVGKGDVQAAKDLVQLKLRMGPSVSDGSFGEVSGMADGVLVGVVLDVAEFSGNHPLLVVADHLGGARLRNVVARALRNTKEPFQEWKMMDQQDGREAE